MDNQDREKDIRLLRGDALAQRLMRFNGHQKPVRLLKFFQPLWLALIVIPIPFMNMLPFLKGVLLLGILGLLFEISLWVYYSITRRNIRAYPGLGVWWQQLQRKTIMVNGRPGSDHSLPD